MPLPACSNCEHPIGSLERPRAWQGRAVCGTCFERLSQDAKELEASPVVRTTFGGTGIRETPVVTRRKWSDVPGPLRAMFWVGAILWILGGFVFGWGIGIVGMVLCIGAVVAWVVILAAK